MKISTKGRYGLRTLIDLAIFHQEAPISLAIIANRQGISMNYLEQVIAILKRAQIVKSIKGAQGGYKLMRRPEELKLKEILVLLEGEFSIIDYDLESESRVRRCIRENVWEAIDENVERILEVITLQDMLDEYQALKEGDLSYFFDVYL